MLYILPTRRKISLEMKLFTQKSYIGWTTRMLPQNNNNCQPKKEENQQNTQTIFEEIARGGCTVLAKRGKLSYLYIISPY